MSQLIDREKLPDVVDPVIRHTMDPKHLRQVCYIACTCLSLSVCVCIDDGPCNLKINVIENVLIHSVTRMTWTKMQLIHIKCINKEPKS